MARAEMFDSFAHEARFTTFLFIGFSLSDPNFNLIRDEARAVMGEAMPISYLVQEHTDPVTPRYLRSLAVEVISLFSWNQLPAFLQALNPGLPGAS
jgi:SIR2-like domain